jgi:hypothetical protein
MSITPYHEINNSSFDSDKNFVIDLVKYHHYRSHLDIEIVNSFYRGQILRYEQRCHEIISNERNNLNRFAVQIENLWKKYFEYLALFEINYEAKIVDIDVIISAFETLAELVCYIYASDYEEFNLNYPKDPNMYPLVNDSGQHSYNSYLYGLINNVILIGIPSDNSPYDDRLLEEDETCPFLFYNHDLFHSYTMKVRGIFEPDNMNDIKRVYYNILLNNNLTRIEKELGIFALWFLIHEKYYTLKKFWTSNIYILFKYEDVQLDIDFGLTIIESLRRNFTDNDLVNCSHRFDNKLIDHHHNCELYTECPHSKIIKQVYINIIARLYGFNLLKNM